MPELPEVEITRQGIAPSISGACIEQARLGKPLRWPLGVAEQTLQGRYIGQVQRRGKYLLLPLVDAAEAVHAARAAQHGTSSTDAAPATVVQGDSFASTAHSTVRTTSPANTPGGAATSCTPANTEAVLAAARTSSPDAAQIQQMLTHGVLLLHLGMSGRLRCAPNLPAAGAHDHFELHTSGGVLRLTDPRRFGAVLYADAQHQHDLAHRLLQGLGVEPLDAQRFTLPYFRQALARRQAAIKQVLLAGDIVVGVGNIYAAEALFAARIHPETAAYHLSATQVRRLWQAIVETLQQALVQGGSTLRDFSHADGSSGYFQLQAAVYGRQGQPCVVCGMLVAQIRQGQRSTCFCPRCQKRR